MKIRIINGGGGQEQGQEAGGLLYQGDVFGNLPVFKDGKAPAPDQYRVGTGPTGDGDINKEDGYLQEYVFCGGYDQDKDTTNWGTDLPKPEAGIGPGIEDSPYFSLNPNSDINTKTDLVNLGFSTT